MTVQDGRPLCFEARVGNKEAVDACAPDPIADAVSKLAVYSSQNSCSLLRGYCTQRLVINERLRWLSRRLMSSQH